MAWVKPEHGKKVFYTLLICLVFSIYFLINRNLTPRYELQTYFDNLIPFAAPFSFFYVSYLGLVWGSIVYALIAMPIERYRRFILSLVTVQFIAYVFYILLPGHIARPAITDDGFGFEVVRTIYAVDMPSTLTPSLHVANSWLIALTLTRRLYIRGALVVWAMLIILSTLFIKQHYIVDVVSGLFLSTTVYIAARRYFTPKEELAG